MSSMSYIDLTGDGTETVPMPVDLSHDPAAQAVYFALLVAPAPPADPPAPDAGEEPTP